MCQPLVRQSDGCTAQLDEAWTYAGQSPRAFGPVERIETSHAYIVRHTDATGFQGFDDLPCDSVITALIYFRLNVYRRSATALAGKALWTI